MLIGGLLWEYACNVPTASVPLSLADRVIRCFSVIIPYQIKYRQESVTKSCTANKALWIKAPLFPRPTKSGTGS